MKLFKKTLHAEHYENIFASIGCLGVFLGLILSLGAWFGGFEFEFTNAISLLGGLCALIAYGIRIEN